MKTLFKAKSILILGIVLLFSSCSKSSGPENDPEEKKQVDVYVLGATGPANGPRTIKYWKNGEQIKLTDGKTTHTADGIFIDNEDVYVVGSQTTEANGQRAIYWKNGQQMPLDQDKGVYSAGKAIGVANGKVYIAGVENADAVYWVDGKIQRLPSSDDHTLSQEFAMHVTDNNDVYIASMLTNRTTQIVKYWKNNVEHVLAPAANEEAGKVSGISVDGNKVYVSGHYQTYSGVGRAMYWEENKEHELTEKLTGARANGIFVKNGNVHVIGFVNSNMQYWYNGQEKALELKDDNNRGDASVITMLHDDVYIGGNVSNIGSQVRTAGYWKNGKWVALEKAADGEYIWITGIAVVER